MGSECSQLPATPDMSRECHGGSREGLTELSVLPQATYKVGNQLPVHPVSTLDLDCVWKGPDPLYPRALEGGWCFPSLRIRVEALWSLFLRGGLVWRGHLCAAPWCLGFYSSLVNGYPQAK